MLRRGLLRKVAESAVVIAAALGLMAFGTWGTFEDPATPLDRSISGHR
ncbi:hypothetical protein ACI78T_17060 [Blastococcus sp. SYSU D00922]